MRARILLGFSLPLFAANAFGWGCEGHQIVALIARAHLTPQASAAVNSILGANPIDPALKRFCQQRPADLMADSATWADDIKNTEKTGLWHYIDIPLTARGDEDVSQWCPPVGQSVNGRDRPGCITDAMEYELGILQDASQSGAQRATALRYVIHFAGDIHQPLHDADNDDRGGNCTVMQFFSEDRPINLHAIWDYKLLEHNPAETRGQKAYAHEIDLRYSAQGEAQRNEKTDPEAWAWEGHQLAASLSYGDLSPAIPVEIPNPAADCDAEREKVAALHITIGDKYYQDTLPKIEERLAAAGNRLAGILNRTF